MITSRHLDVSSVRYLVLDEADEMLRMGFQEQVEAICTNMPPPADRTTMLWSATVPPWVAGIARSYAKQPLLIDCVGDDEGRLPATATFRTVVVSNITREAALVAAIQSVMRVGLTGREAGARASPRALVFTDTKAEAAELAEKLGALPAVAGGAALRAAALTGDLSQPAREEALAGFKAGRINVLVATDVAARGLDIPSVEAVLHYRLPDNQEAFVHRSGRTARAGRDGAVGILATTSELSLLARWQAELRFEAPIAAASHVCASAAAAAAPAVPSPDQAFVQALPQLLS